MDIEGNEQWGVKYFEKSFEAGCIKNVIMEISPVFNNSYPSIIEKMKGFGYDIYLLDGTKWDGELNFDQSNFLFKKL